MTTAFVLAGGASLGAIEVGMLGVLYERGISPDLIVGTSAGALNGAFIASRPQTVATADALGELWRGLRRGQVFPFRPLSGLLGFAGTRNHLVLGEPLRQLVARHLQVARLEEMAIPLHVVAVDAHSGASVRLSAGDALDAVTASAAIPGVLPPVQLDGRLLIDGGVSDGTPISHAIELGADVVWVLPTGHACALQRTPRGALAMALQALSILIERQLDDDIQRYADVARLIVLPPPCPQPVGPIDFSHADQLITTAAETTRAFLDAGGEAHQPLRLAPHTHAAARS